MTPALLTYIPGMSRYGVLSADAKGGPHVLVTGASDSTIIVWLWEPSNADVPYRIAACLTVSAHLMVPNQITSSAAKPAELHEHHLTMRLTMLEWPLCHP